MIVDPPSLVTVITSIDLHVCNVTTGRPCSVAKVSQCLDLLFVVELTVIAGGYAHHVFVFKLIVTDCLLPVSPVYVYTCFLVFCLAVCVCVCVCVCVK